MAGWTNKGKARALSLLFRNEGAPATFYLALCAATTVPGPDTNTLGELTQIAVGNGYSDGGAAVARSAVGFDPTTEDDINDRALIQLADVVWTAAGGPIPATGSGARYAVLIDDNVTIASREVLAFWDLAADRTVSDTQTLTIQDAELRLTE